MEEIKSNRQILHCLVVDDEPIAREGMVDLINHVDFLSVSGTCASAMEAIGFMRENRTFGRLSFAGRGLSAETGHIQTVLSGGIESARDIPVAGMDAKC